MPDPCADSRAHRRADFHTDRGSNGFWRTANDRSADDSGNTHADRGTNGFGGNDRSANDSGNDCCANDC
jgi:hypothetical protein